MDKEELKEFCEKNIHHIIGVIMPLITLIIIVIVSLSLRVV